MSKLFNQFVNEVFGNNPYMYDEAKRIEAEAQEHQYYAEREKFKIGLKNPTNTSLTEWEQLGSPRKTK